MQSNKNCTPLWVWKRVAKPANLFFLSFSWIPAAASYAFLTAPDQTLQQRIIPVFMGEGALLSHKPTVVSATSAYDTHGIRWLLEFLGVDKYLYIRDLPDENTGVDARAYAMDFVWTDDFHRVLQCPDLFSPEHGDNVVVAETLGREWLQRAKDIGYPIHPFMPQNFEEEG